MERRREQGVSDTTINRDLALLSAAIGYANVELEWMLPNPVAGRKLAEPEGRVRWITREESVALIEAAGRAPRAPFMADLIAVGRTARRDTGFVGAQHDDDDRTLRLPCPGESEDNRRQARYVTF